METCEDGNADNNDPQIISLMGNSDLNFGDTSMMYDPRVMLDLVRSGEHNEDGLTTTFQGNFQQPSNGHPLSSLNSPIFNNRNPLSSSNSSPFFHSLVTVSSSSISSSSVQAKVSTSLHECSPSAFHPPLNSPSSLPNDKSSQEPPPVFQISLTTLPQASSHSNPELSSPLNDNGSEAANDHHNSSGDPSNLEDLPDHLALHTPPLHQHNFSMYYPESQSPVSVTITRNFTNGNGYLPGNGFSFIPTHADHTHRNDQNDPNHNHPPQPQSALSPEHHAPQHTFNIKREKDRVSLSHLKQEINDEMPDNEVPNPANGDQPPYASFANMNLNNERANLEGLTMRTNHRNSSGDGTLSQPNLLSPIRPPVDSTCSTPNNNASTPRGLHPHGHIPVYGITSPPPQMILDPSHLTNRLNVVPVQLQQHLQQQPQHQQHLFQSIPLHNISLNAHSQNSPLSNSADTPMSGFPPLNMNPYEDPLHNESLSNAARNLSFNYGDIIASTNGLPNSPNNFISQNMDYQSRTTKILNKRNSSVSQNRRKEDEAFETCSSDSFSNNDSDDESLVIDTSGSGTEGYECGECKQVCRTRGSLRKHLVTEHLSNEPEPAETIFKEYACPLSICNFATSLRDELDRHLAEHINDGWTPTGKKRHNKNPLQRHRYNKEEFQCPHCEYSCVVEKAFKRHVAAHELGQEELEIMMDKVSCQICGKDRPNDAALRMHMKKHRKGKFYKCDICKFKSVQLKKLIQHRRMHTGEKPHLCPYCVYRAARRDNLRSHVRRMHKKSNMFCDTFTPRPLIVAQVEANLPHAIHHHSTNSHNVRQQQEQQHRRSVMNLSQHQNHSVQQIPLMDRLQQHHHQQNSQQMSPQGMGSIPPHVLGVGTLSPSENSDYSSIEHVQLTQGNGLMFSPNNSQHNNVMSSPQAH